MAGFTDNQLKQRIIDEMDDNTVVIFANVNGAKIYAKLRGCSSGEMGVMMGSIKASVNRQIRLFHEQILKSKGAESYNQFIDGLKQGEKSIPTHEGIRLRELGDPNER